jgi:quercetin dioxygenase-like cupin family protein
MELERIPWPGPDRPAEAQLRASLVADGFGAWRWSDSPGATYEPHTHPSDESLWVIEGCIDFFVAGETYRLGPGDRLQLPAGTVHGAKAGPAGATYLIGELSRASR